MLHPSFHPIFHPISPTPAIRDTWHNVYSEPKMSTYPRYTPPQTLAYTFDALTFSPGIFYETLMHPSTRSGSPHNALHYVSRISYVSLI